MKPCPHCGKKTGFVIVGKTNNFFNHFFDKHGNYISTIHGDADIRTFKEIECENCRKVIKDVYLDDEMTIREVIK